MRSAVEDENAFRIDNTEGTGSVGKQLVDIAVTIRIAVVARSIRYLQYSDFSVGFKLGFIGKLRIIKIQFGNLGSFIRLDEIVTIVALVGDHVVGFAVGTGKRCYGIGHVLAIYRQVCPGKIPAILVAAVERQAEEALLSERNDVAEGACFDVENGDGVVFLKGDECGRSIRRDADVLGFEILCDCDAFESGFSGKKPDAGSFEFVDPVVEILE